MTWFLYLAAGAALAVSAAASREKTKKALNKAWNSFLNVLPALAAMLLGWRRANRRAWLAGAGLLAVVVVKLFLIDLDGIGTVARIVSFLGVGLLMLVMGYFCPLPPKEGK